MTAKERVEKGAELLDEKRQGWEDEIVLDVLDLGSCRNCIIGQLYPVFSNVVTAMEELGIEGYDPDYGFEVMLVNDEYEELDTLWTKEIRSRRNANCS